MDKSLKEKLKILHAPTTVGGNPQGLAEAEKFCGYDSRTLTIAQNYFAYKADIVVLDGNEGVLLSHFKRWKAMLSALRNYNVLHYNFGQTIAPFRSDTISNTHPKWITFLYRDVYCRLSEHLDLRLAKILGHVTAVTYQGDDARQGDYCLENYDITFAKEVPEDYYGQRSDALKRERIARVDKLADIIYAVNPDLLNVLPARAKFIPYANVNPQTWSYVGVAENIDCPHIIHAPSHRDVKGTQYILDAFDRLEKEGINFRFTLVENMSNEDARKVYETADLVIDQLLAGYYGGFAIECMALGKPVICYMRDSDMPYLPEKMQSDMPIINAKPDTIYTVLKDYLTTRKHDLHDLGLKSRKYVEIWHDPVKIAQITLSDYETVYLKKHGKNKVEKSCAV